MPTACARRGGSPPSHKKWQDRQNAIVAVSQHIRSVSLETRHPRVDDAERDGVIFVRIDAERAADAKSLLDCMTAGE